MTETAGVVFTVFAYVYTVVSIIRLAMKGWTYEINSAQFGVDQMASDQKLGQYTRMKDAEAYRRMREQVEQ